MEDFSKLEINMSKEELELVIYALSAAPPINKTLELTQYLLYHRLLTKLNELQ